MSIIVFACPVAMSPIGQRQPLQLLFFYGRNGAGKDSEADLLVSEHQDYAIISTGDRIKEAQSPSNKFHYLVKDYMDLVAQGVNLPKEVVLNLNEPDRSFYPAFVEDEVANGARTIISTGFPRTIAQMNDLEVYLTRLSQRFNLDVRHVYFDVDEETARARCLNRPAEYRALGRPVRNDDNAETVERRFAVFRQDTLPLIERLRERGMLIEIPADGTKAETHRQTVIALEGKAPELESVEISHPRREML